MVKNKNKGGRGGDPQRYIQDLEEHIRVLEERVRELTELCAHDPLTGLLKSDGFEQEVLLRMEGMSRKKRADDTCRIVGPVAIVFVDVDHFKKVNDACGYEEGDEILRILANIIRDEDLVVRRGGDEFLIALFDMDKDVAGERLMGMRTQFEIAVANSKKLPKLPFVVSFSFGIQMVSYPSDAVLLKKAEHDAGEEMKRHKERRGMGR